MQSHHHPSTTPTSLLEDDDDDDVIVKHGTNNFNDHDSHDIAPSTPEPPRHHRDHHRDRRNEDDDPMNSAAAAVLAGLNMDDDDEDDDDDGAIVVATSFRPTHATIVSEQWGEPHVSGDADVSPFASPSLPGRSSTSPAPSHPNSKNTTTTDDDTDAAIWAKLKKLRCTQLATAELSGTVTMFTPYDEMRDVAALASSPCEVKLFVGGLRFEMTREEVARVMCHYGKEPVAPTAVELFRRGTRSSGCATVHVPTQAAAQRLLRLSKKILCEEDGVRLVDDVAKMDEYAKRLSAEVKGPRHALVIEVPHSGHQQHYKASASPSPQASPLPIGGTTTSAPVSVSPPAIPIIQSQGARPPQGHVMQQPVASQQQQYTMFQQQPQQQQVFYVQQPQQQNQPVQYVIYQQPGGQPQPMRVVYQQQPQAQQQPQYVYLRPQQQQQQQQPSQQVYLQQQPL
eukprot:PhM_4_TR7001/c0_g1_i1/m.39520